MCIIFKLVNSCSIDLGISVTVFKLLNRPKYEVNVTLVVGKIDKAQQTKVQQVAQSNEKTHCRKVNFRATVGPQLTQYICNSKL